ncbi:hypothetical protein [Bradyrhizobium sp. 33ap4]|uniref:hypothetical protein n=1 Tax=Bradyrhizobium sp. 33ap4 TaxID=3061630 RepID=UPI00292F0512|nr:hypothetical protein [Bradyrhizobium sp. 33ap4]
MSEFALAETRYALSGEVNIACQVMGEGPIDIIMVLGGFSRVDFQPAFARVTTFDKRGDGLSDRIPMLLPLSNVWTTFAPSWIQQLAHHKR